MVDQNAWAHGDGAASQMSSLQEVLDLYGVQSCMSEQERVSRKPTGEYMVDLGAAVGSTVVHVPFFDDDDVAGLARRMLAQGSPLTLRFIYRYVTSLVDDGASSNASIPPFCPLPRQIEDGDPQDARLRRAKIFDFPPALLRRYAEETEGGSFGDIQTVCFPREDLALLAVAIDRRHNRANAEAVMRCLSRALGRHEMLHGLTRDDIDRLPLPNIVATFGDPHVSCRIHLKEWLLLHDMACRDTTPNVAVVIPVVIHFGGKGRESVADEEQFAPAHIFVSMWRKPYHKSFRRDGHNYLEFIGGSGAELHFGLWPGGMSGGGMAHLFLKEEYDWVDWHEVRRERWRVSRAPEVGWRLLAPPSTDRLLLKRKQDWYEDVPAPDSKSETTSLTRWKRSARHCDRQDPLIYGARILGGASEDLRADGLVARRVKESVSNSRGAMLLRKSLGEHFSNGVLRMTEESLDAEALGLRWRKCAGTQQPPAGEELMDAPAALTAALANQKLEFEAEEWKDFGVRNLKAVHFIKVGSDYFQPTGAAAVQMVFYEVLYEDKMDDTSVPAIGCFACALFDCIYSDHTPGVAFLVEAFAVEESVRGKGYGDIIYHKLCRRIAAWHSQRYTVIAQTLTTAKAKQFWEERLDSTSRARSMMLQLHIMYPQLRILYHGSTCLCKEREYWDP